MVHILDRSRFVDHFLDFILHQYGLFDGIFNPLQLFLAGIIEDYELRLKGLLLLGRLGLDLFNDVVGIFQLLGHANILIDDLRTTSVTDRRYEKHLVEPSFEG